MGVDQYANERALLGLQPKNCRSDALSPSCIAYGCLLPSRQVAETCLVENLNRRTQNPDKVSLPSLIDYRGPLRELREA